MDKKSPAGISRAFLIDWILRGLKFYNIRCSRAFGSVNNVELYTGTFIERFKALSLNSRVMDKYVLAAILLDKTKSFCIIKPFYCTF